MASDENPYFDAHVASSSSSAARTTASTPEPPVTIGNPATPAGEQPPPLASPARNVLFQPLGARRQQSSIRLRRYSTATPAITVQPAPSEEPDADPYAQPPPASSSSGGSGGNNGRLTVDSAAMGRQRSNSGSRSLRLAQALSFNRMPTIQDENNPPSNSDRVDHALKAQNKKAAGGANGAAMVNQQEYASNIVDFLDVIGQFIPIIYVFRIPAGDNTPEKQK